ncbi:MAG: hypothetical protein H6729_10280 [Deltaproteobacteria bacterium]|nr:hypothetical protein [Deltaproteobacteria bacterium]
MRFIGDAGWRPFVLVLLGVTSTMLAATGCGGGDGGGSDPGALAARDGGEGGQQAADAGGTGDVGNVEGVGAEAGVSVHTDADVAGHDAEASQDAGAESDANDDANDDAKLPLALIYHAPASGIDLADGTLRTGFDAIITASRVANASGQATGIVTVGTLVESSTSLTYQPEPSNALVVKRANGVTMTFHVYAADGSSVEPAEFFDHDHVLDLDARVDGSIDVRASSARRGRYLDLRITGSVVLEGATVGVALLKSTDTQFESDSTGQDYKSEGTISGEIFTDAWRLQVDESSGFQLVSVTSERETSTSSVRNIRSRLVTPSDTFTYADVVIKKAFHNGDPVDESFWVCSGQLLRNGAPYGVFERDVRLADPRDGGGFILFGLRVGETWLELERWRGYYERPGGS